MNAKHVAHKFLCGWARCVKTAANSGRPRDYDRLVDVYAAYTGLVGLDFVDDVFTALHEERIRLRWPGPKPGVLSCELTIESAIAIFWLRGMRDIVRRNPDALFFEGYVRCPM